MFIHEISPILFQTGPISIRWYGLLFALGITLNYLYTQKIFRRNQLSLNDLDSIALYLVIGMIVGARLGHILFYNLDYFLAHPLEIFQIWHGGLASHGAAIGVLIAYFLWTRLHKVPFSKYPDLLVLGMPLTAGFVRLGNFFNSEILGKPTDGTWGVVFTKIGEIVPRHPSQLYEAALSFLIFIILYLVQKKYYPRLAKYFILFLYVLLYFSSRFLVEFWKEKIGVPPDFPISMGQILSIIPILIALSYFFSSCSGEKKTNHSNLV